MEYLVPVGVGVGVALLFGAVASWQRQQTLRRLQSGLERVRRDLELLQAKQQQAQFLDLDLSSLETKAEDNAAQLQLWMQQAVEDVARDMDALEDRIERLEETVSDLGEALEQIDDLEERLASLEEADVDHVVSPRPTL